MVVYAVCYDIENQGYGILDFYSSKKESIEAIIKECFVEGETLTKEELFNQINKYDEYSWEKGRYYVESRKVELELYIALYEDYVHGYSHTVGVMKSEEGIIELIANDIMRNKDTEVTREEIKKKLKEYKEYGEYSWEYKIRIEKIEEEQYIYSCEKFFIIKDYESNRFKAYRNNGLFIHSAEMGIEEFKQDIKEMLD